MTVRALDVDSAMARLADALREALSLAELWTAYDGRRSSPVALQAAVEATIVAIRDVRTVLGPDGRER